MRKNHPAYPRAPWDHRLSQRVLEQPRPPVGRRRTRLTSVMVARRRTCRRSLQPTAAAAARRLRQVHDRMMFSIVKRYGDAIGEDALMNEGIHEHLDHE